MLIMRAITLPGWYVLSFICSLPLLANLWLGKDSRCATGRRWVYIHALCIVLECGFGNQYYSMQGIEKKWL
jgi:hypothetical protein